MPSRTQRPSPLRGRSRPRRLQIGGRASDFPFKIPFRFPARRRPRGPALRPFPHPALRSLTCGPGLAAGGTRENPRACPRGPTGSGARRRAAGAAAREGGGGALPPRGPRREPLNLYRRPLAHTNPAAAAAVRHDATRRPPPPPRSPAPPTAGARPVPSPCAWGVLARETEALLQPRPFCNLPAGPGAREQPAVPLPACSPPPACWHLGCVDVMLASPAW